MTPTAEQRARARMKAEDDARFAAAIADEKAKDERAQRLSEAVARLSELRAQLEHDTKDLERAADTIRLKQEELVPLYGAASDATAKRDATRTALLRAEALVESLHPDPIRDLASGRDVDALRAAIDGLALDKNGARGLHGVRISDSVDIRLLEAIARGLAYCEAKTRNDLMERLENRARGRA